MKEMYKFKYKKVSWTPSLRHPSCCAECECEGLHWKKAIQSSDSRKLIRKVHLMCLIINECATSVIYLYL